MTLSNESVAVITGAASGIGRALAIRMAREGIAGVAIADMNEDGLKETAELVESLGTKVTTHVLDVSDRSGVEQFARDVLDKHGRATHLINNAGVGLIGRFEHLSIEDFEWLMGINFWVVVDCTKVFLPTLLEQKSATHRECLECVRLDRSVGTNRILSSKFAVRGFHRKSAA